MEKPVNDELDMANLQLDEAERANFWAEVAHELKTPITSLRAMAQLALMRYRQAPGEANLETLLTRLIDESDHLAELVDNLSNLARLGWTQKGLSLQHCDICLVLLNLHVDAPDGRALRVEAPAQPTLVNIDEPSIRQAITLMVDNAVQYAKSPIWLRVRRQDDEVEIAVEDEGEPVPQPDHPRLFNRFFRGERGRQLNPGGTGVSLYFCREIVERHGGEVFYERRGERNRFGFTLPVAEDAHCAEGQ